MEVLFENIVNWCHPGTKD